MLKNELQNHILENLTTAVMLLNSRLEIVYINSAGEELFDASEQRAIGLPITELCFDVTEDFAAELEKSVNFNIAYTKRKAKIAVPPERTLMVDYTVTPMIDGNETHLLIELAAIDRMLRINKDEAMLASQKTNRVLMKGLAHEIKNPLGGIRGAAQLLARELPSEELCDYTNIIIEEADRLRNLVDRMLGPHKAFMFKSLNIHEVLERCKVLILAETSGIIKIERDYDPSIPEVVGDAEQLIQATLNIMRNAMQALLEDPSIDKKSITLCTRAVRRFTIGNQLHPLVCKIDIVDNGPGIPAELQESIFLPMVSGRAEGTGLGLSISQSILNQHNGLIECESKAGRTKFSIYIPLGLNHEH